MSSVDRSAAQPPAGVGTAVATHNTSGEDSPFEEGGMDLRYGSGTETRFRTYAADLRSSERLIFQLSRSGQWSMGWSPPHRINTAVRNLYIG